MKDELRIYCRLEGWNEEHLRARIKEDKKLRRRGKRSEAEILIDCGRLKSAAEEIKPVG
jgi:hypothetical protein